MKPAHLFETVYGILWVGLFVWTVLRLFNAATANHIRSAQAQGEVDRSIAHRTKLVRKIVNVLKSAFIKYCRFNEEGIEIPFPIRTVILKIPNGESVAEVEEALKGVR